MPPCEHKPRIDGVSEGNDGRWHVKLICTSCDAIGYALLLPEDVEEIDWGDEDGP